MKFSTIKIVALAFGFSTFASAAYITTLTGGSTEIRVNGNTGPSGCTNCGEIKANNGGMNTTGNSANPGQLGQLTAFGFEVYDADNSVRDFGYLYNGALSSNNAGGFNPAPNPTNVTPAGPGFSTTSVGFNLAGTVITTAGLFTNNGINVAYSKSYRFVAANILEEVFTVTNNGSAISNFTGFSVYDPDRHLSGTTVQASTNSVLTGSGFRYAQANFTGLNAVLATRDAAVNVGFLTNYTADCIAALVGSGSTCTNALTNGTTADRAYAYAFNIGTFGAGASQSFITYQIFGIDSTGVSAALQSIGGSSSSSSSSSGGVPEPGTMSLMGAACVALGVIARRRVKK